MSPVSKNRSIGERTAPSRDQSRDRPCHSRGENIVLAVNEVGQKMSRYSDSTDRDRKTNELDYSRKVRLREEEPGGWSS